MYEIVFFITVILILAIIVLFVYFALSEDIFNVLIPRLDEKVDPVSEEVEVVKTSIDTKIGDISDSSNVSEYIGDKIKTQDDKFQTDLTNYVTTDSLNTNLNSYVTTDSLNTNLNSYVTTESIIPITKNGDNTPFDYIIGDPLSVKNIDIDAVEDVTIKSGLKICNDETCYKFNVDNENGNLVIQKEGGTNDTPGNIQIKNNIYVNEYYNLDDTLNINSDSTSLTTKLNKKIDLSTMSNYPTIDQYTHNADGGINTSGFIPTKFSYTQDSDGKSIVNGIYPVKNELTNYAPLVHYHKNTWDGSSTGQTEENIKGHIYQTPLPSS